MEVVTPLDALLLARMQFATTVGFHWLFLFLTLGLAPLVAVLHTRYATTGNPVFERMTRFWGQLYVVNYVLGIVTGLVMEFQFGLAWSGLSKFAGNVFGAPLALETLIAFFAESTFLGMWIFGWGKLGRKTHVLLIWLVTLTAYASAYWILLANGFMQHPVGYVVRDGVAYLTDFGAVLTNPSALMALGHIAGAALLTGGLFVAGVSAYHFIKRTRELEFFTRSLRLGIGVAAPAALVTVGFGFGQFPVLGRFQPGKFGSPAEQAQFQAAMVERFGPGNYLPPDWIGLPLGFMIVLGQFMLVAGVVAVPLLYRNWIVRARPLAYLLVATIPLPFFVSVLGWVFREVGRQPFIVYGELTTAAARSQVSSTTMLISFITFTSLFVLLAVADWVLIARFAGRGPEGTQLGARPSEPADEPVSAF